MSFAIPVERLRENDLLLAFHHPQPAYPFHVLIIPKKPIKDLLALTPGDMAILQACVQTAQDLIKEYHLETAGYRLITNGGSFQDVPQLHFHLISEKEINERKP